VLALASPAPILGTSLKGLQQVYNTLAMAYNKFIAHSQ